MRVEPSSSASMFTWPTLVAAASRGGMGKLAEAAAMGGAAPRSA